MNQSVINAIVQSRVVDKLCIDCGTALIDTPGYCGNEKCGYAKNPITYIKDADKDDLREQAEERREEQIEIHNHPSEGFTT